MEDCLPFHSRNLPFHSGIFHTEISVPFHTMPYMQHQTSLKLYLYKCSVNKLTVDIDYYSFYQWRLLPNWNWRVAKFSAAQKLLSNIKH